MIWEDLRNKARCFYGRCEFADVLRVSLADGTSAVVLFRLAKFLQGLHLGPLAVLVLDLNKLLNGCVIGRGAEFAPGFVLVHTVGVVIHGSVRGGRNVIIESGVVVGAARNGFPIEVPVIGDDVYIGAGAKLLGGIRIGSRVTIGANAVVVKDVPDDATAVGVPAKVIGRAGPA
jgi:serine O-acetyltransferase